MYYIILDSKWTVTEYLKERKRGLKCLFYVNYFHYYKLWSAKKALLEVTYHIVKIHVKNDVTIVLEFLIFLVVKKIEENYPK